MADDEEPPEGLFYDPDEPPQDPPLPEDFSPEEIDAINRLAVISGDVTSIPQDGAKVLAFRNADKEPVVVPTAVATEAERAYRAWNLRLGGKSWAQVAEVEMYPTAAAAAADVDRYMSQARALVVEASAKAMLELEVARLDALQNYAWPLVMGGSLHAITEVRHLVMARVQVVATLGRFANADDANHTTVVVSAEDDDYIATLKAAAGEAGAAPTTPA